MAQTLDAFGPNSTFSARSLTYRGWAPNNLPFNGGIVFGKGEARFLVGDEDAQTTVSAESIGVRFEKRKHLVILADDQDQQFILEAHAIAVCPMARHVARHAPIGFTIPPYLDGAYLQRIGLSSYREGFIADEFDVDDRVARLVYEADFWPEHVNLEFVRMNPDVRRLILDDVNSVMVSLPGQEQLYRGLTYFSGDFHTSAVILLNRNTSKAVVFGAPVVYTPEETPAGQIIISDVEFLASHPDDTLATDGSYGGRDFKSLFDLSLLFAALRDGAPDTFDGFIMRYC